MRTSTRACLAAMLVLACACRSLAGAETKDGFVMRNGQIRITRNGETRTMVDNVKLYDGTIVRTNGAVKIPGGGRTTLHEGDTMSFGGTITRAATGAVEMTADGAFMKDGRMMIASDTKALAMDAKFITMNDGTKVMKDGMVITPSGRKTLLKDGDEVLMDGRLQRY